MTVQKSFKRLVRTRMQKTGESYTSARAALLAARQAPERDDAPRLPTTDDEIRRRTGRGWEEWFDLLDGWGGQDLPHRDIARRLAEEEGLHPLAWNVQAVVGGYERARGLRAVGEHADGFRIGVTRTMDAAAERLYDAFVSEAQRERWLPGADLRVRTATAPRSARFDWAGGATRVHVVLQAKGDARTTVSLEHVRLPDARRADEARAFWRDRLGDLRALVERDGD